MNYIDFYRAARKYTHTLWQSTVNVIIYDLDYSIDLRVQYLPWNRVYYNDYRTYVILHLYLALNNILGITIDNKKNTEDHRKYLTLHNISGLMI